MDDREKVVEKVRKLMSLAENAGNENEAANAFSKTRIFMKKYHLELSDIYSAEPSPPAPSPRRKTPPRPLTPEEEPRPVRLHITGPALIFTILLLFVVYILYLQ
ncbi:DUF2786 domain-containing protein [Morganella morganii]|uniref:DUF2786 domain-containing protein n=1 Tax=Morganella morganii TaxID=582 RepID=UPI0030FE7DDF